MEVGLGASVEVLAVDVGVLVNRASDEAREPDAQASRPNDNTIAGKNNGVARVTPL